MTKNDDSTKFFNDENDTLAMNNGNTLLNEDSTVVMNNEDEETQFEAAEDNADNDARASKKSGVLNKGNMAAAGIGVAVGAAAGSAVSMNAGNSASNAELNIDEAKLMGDEVSADAKDAPLQVSGPNPAEAAAMARNAGVQMHQSNTQSTSAAEMVHQAGTQMHEANVEPEPASDVTDEISIDSALPAATVDDSMSFSQAFAAARAQVGAGGVFTWHGKIYGTYYENEWNQMSSAERHDFQMAALDQQHTPHAPHTTPIDVHAGEVSTDELAYADKVDDVADFDDVAVSDGDNEIRVLGVETMTDNEGNPVTVGALDINGAPVVMIDIDNDGTMDVAAADFNGDGHITAEEAFDISDANITTEDFNVPTQEEVTLEQAYDVNDTASYDVPDFDNNADVSSYDLG